MRISKNPKVVMLGIDAGDLDFMQAWLPQLPHLRRCLENGRLHHLNTPSQFLTGSVWPTFYTGTPPGEHGIYHHLQWDSQAMRLRRVSADWLLCEPFWYDLGRRGIKVTVLDVPMTFPSRLQGGVEVVNWGSHDRLGRFHSNRSSLAREIRRRFGAHPMGPEIPVTKTRDQLARIRHNLIRGAARKGALIGWLLESTDWDFFLAVFGECHRGGHILWPENDPRSLIAHDALLDVYRAVDKALGGVIKRLEAHHTTVIVFALHGMQANMSQEHFTPKIIDSVNAIYANQNLALPGPLPREQLGLMRRLRTTLPPRLQNMIAQCVPTGVRDWVVTHATAGGYDWKHTPGFALLADDNGYLRFNLMGREALGCLQPNSRHHRQYVNLLQDCFYRLQNKSTGSPLVKEIVSTSKAFPGKRSAQLPDLIVTWEAGIPAATVRSSALGTLSAQRDTGRSGNHRHQGFALILDSQGSGWPPLAGICDLAPAIAQWLAPR